MNLLLIFQSTPGDVMPISGYALCFIPLAAVIIGFIIAARYTDRQATSTYLRVLPASKAAVSASGATGGRSTSDKPFMSFFSNEQPVSLPTPKNPTYEEMIPPIPRPVVATPVVPAAPAIRTPATAVAAAAPAVAAAAAIASGVAITRVGWDAPGNKAEEYVQIENTTGAPVDITGWQLIEEKQGLRFTFPAYVLPAHSQIRVWSGAGKSDKTDLYMNSTTPIWNTAGGTATLQDAKGAVVSHWSYEMRKRS